MIHRTAEFKVTEGNLESALDAIRNFVLIVNQKEENCKMYRSMQKAEDPFTFLHYMIFENDRAQEHHTTTEWVKNFVEILYPLLEDKPVFTTFKVIEG